jgi:hypothetical protein
MTQSQMRLCDLALRPLTLAGCGSAGCVDKRSPMEFDDG